ncbi:MAG: hypothetical protein KC464_25750, partial [Myxococcales bacterium]|nr:hypothetical protein [Myxococcales bacterium]
MSAVPCHVCAAPFDDDTALYCRSCGAKRAAGVADLEAYRTGRERYELVTRQPAYEAAQRWRPRLRFGHEVGRPLLMMVLGGGFGVLFLATVRLVRAPAYFTWVGVGIVGGFLLVALLQTLLGIRRLLARSERAVAVVMDDRAGGDELVAPHLVDLRFIDGSRRKVRGAGDVMGAVAVGDIGVAYLQADRLVDFRWFDVMPAPL